MRDNWKICYTAYTGAGETLVENRKKQFTYANICAKTAVEAIQKLKDEFPMLTIKTYGQPMHSLVTDAEYNSLS